MPDYDRLWKDIISELFEEFLLFFAADLYEQIDFSQQPQSKEQELHKLFPKSKSKDRTADKLVGLKLKNGEEQWILVHIEVQGTSESNFSKRMYQYFYRVQDKFDRDLYTIAIYTDDSPSFKPDTYNYEFFGTRLTYEFNTYKILEQDEKKLQFSNNPFALVILAGLYVIKGRQQKNQKYHYKMKLMRLLLGKSHIPREKIQRLFIFIDHVIELSEEEMEQFVEEITPIMEKEDPEMALSLEDTSFARYYKKIGNEEGQIQGQMLVALELLKDGMSVELVAKYTKLPISVVENIKSEREKNDGKC